jgi:hypothetical protein
MREVEHVIAAYKVRDHLFPQATFEDGKLDPPISHVRPFWKPPGRFWKEDLVFILTIDPSQCSDQPSTIAPDSNVKVPEVPGSNDNLHVL